MKIWIRIALFALITSILIIELIFFEMRQIYENEQIRLHGEQLKAISTLSALSLEAEKVDELFTSLPEPGNDSLADELDKVLLDIKTSLGLRQEIYSLHMIDSNKAIYGPNTNVSVPVGDTLTIVSPIRQKNIWDVYNNKSSLHTPIYQNKSGTWIAGMAPVISPDGRVSAIVTTSFDPDSINVAISTFNNDLLITRLIIFPILIIFSVIISRQISRPITQVTDFMESFSYFGKGKKLEIQSGGEVQRLIDAANKMHSKILNQQTKMRRIISDLRKAQRKAQSLHNMESSFLRIISHELRTPLSGMSVSPILKEEVQSAKFEDEEVKTELLEYVEMLDDSYNRLKDFVELVLTYIEYQSGDIQFDQKEIRCVELINNSIEEFKSERNDVNVYYINKLDRNMTLRLDPIKCTFLIKALINNIAKYSVEKSVIIKEYISDDNELCIEFKSNREGIAMINPKYFWEPFKDSNLLRRREGTGLRLAISKVIVERQGGEIYMSQEKETKGITFTVKFDLKKQLQPNEV